MKFQRLETEQERIAGPSRHLRGERRIAELEMSPAVVLVKVAKAEGRIKKLHADGRGSEMQSTSVERKCRKLKVEGAGLRSKLQTALSRVLERGCRPGQRAVVDLSVKNEMVAALKTQTTTLRSQVKAMKDEDRD